jgi:hypothetical protein
MWVMASFIGRSNMQICLALLCASVANQLLAVYLMFSGAWMLALGALKNAVSIRG